MNIFNIARYAKRQHNKSMGMQNNDDNGTLVTKRQTGKPSMKCNWYAFKCTRIKCKTIQLELKLQEKENNLNKFTVIYQFSTLNFQYKSNKHPSLAALCDFIVFVCAGN